MVFKAGGANLRQLRVSGNRICNRRRRGTRDRIGVHGCKAGAMHFLHL